MKLLQLMGFTKEEIAIIDNDPGKLEKMLKTQYKKLVLKVHPDKNNGSKIAEEHFKCLSDIYVTLSKEENFKKYLANHEAYHQKHPLKKDNNDINIDILTNLSGDADDFKNIYALLKAITDGPAPLINYTEKLIDRIKSDYEQYKNNEESYLLNLNDKNLKDYVELIQKPNIDPVRVNQFLSRESRYYQFLMESCKKTKNTLNEITSLKNLFPGQTPLVRLKEIIKMRRTTIGIFLEKADYAPLIKDLGVEEFLSLIDFLRDWSEVDLYRKVLEASNQDITSENLKKFKAFENFDEQDEHQSVLLQWAIDNRNRPLIQNIASHHLNENQFVNLLHKLNDVSVVLFQEALSAWGKKISLETIKGFKNFGTTNRGALVGWVLNQQYSQEEVEEIIQLLENELKEQNLVGQDPMSISFDANPSDAIPESFSLHEADVPEYWKKIWEEEIKSNGTIRSEWISAFRFLSSFLAEHQVELEKIESLSTKKAVELARSLFDIYEIKTLNNFKINNDIAAWKITFEEALNQAPAEPESKNREPSSHEEDLKEELTKAQEENFIKFSPLWKEELLKRPGSSSFTELGDEMNKALDLLFREFIKRNIEFERICELSDDKLKYLIPSLAQIYAAIELKIMDKDGIDQQFKEWKEYLDGELNQAQAAPEEVNKQPSFQEENIKVLSEQEQKIKDSWLSSVLKCRVRAKGFTDENWENLLPLFLPKFIHYKIKFEEFGSLTTVKSRHLLDDLLGICSDWLKGDKMDSWLNQKVQQWKVEFEHVLSQKNNPGSVAKLGLFDKSTSFRKYENEFQGINELINKFKEEATEIATSPDEQKVVASLLESLTTSKNNLRFDISVHKITSFNNDIDKTIEQAEFKLQDPKWNVPLEQLKNNLGTHAKKMAQFMMTGIGQHPYFNLNVTKDLFTTDPGNQTPQFKF